MKLRKLFIALALLVIVVLAFAWYDGGEEPMREISEPVALPEGFQ